MTKQSNKTKKQEIICPKCKTQKTKKDGKRKTDNRGLIQRYKCKECSYRFVEDNGFFRMRNHPKKITCALDLFYRGVSTRKVQEHFQAFYPHNCSNKTIYKWVIKYSQMISNFTDKIKINNGKEIQLDEMEYHRRIDHNKKGVSKDWFIDSIDTKTRFLISAEYVKSRGKTEITYAFKETKQRTNNHILLCTTDGLLTYPDVIKKVWGYHSLRTKEVIHNRVNASKGEGFNILYGLNTIEGNPVFLKHIIDALKPEGKAGIVVPDGVLFGKGKDYIKVRKLLVETCNVKAVIQLDTAVFRPYTAQPTSILIFEKKKQTDKIWFFEVVEDGFKKTTSKKGRLPIKKDDLPTLRALWNDKQETDKSFFADFEKIKNAPRNDYKLFMNYHKPRREIKNPKELGKICESFILGGTPAKKNKEYYGGKHLWVNISDMKDKFVTDTQFKLSDKGKEYLKSKEIKKGTLLMSFKLTLGKTAFAGKNLFTNEAICGLIPKDKDDKNFEEYLYYILPLVNYIPYAQRASKGLTLNKDLIATVEIPFPDKTERKRIIKNLKIMIEELKVKKEEFKKDIEKRENIINDFMESIIA